MLPYIKIRCHFKLLTNATFTEYPGSTLRSLFITALRNVCCHDKTIQCKKCFLKKHCVFPFLTKHQTRTGEDTVQPYVISCTDIVPTLQQGNRLSFDLVLVGEKAISFFPYIAYSFSRWNKMKLGRFQYLLKNRINHYHGKIEFQRINSPDGRMELTGLEHIELHGKLPVFASDGQEITPPEPEMFKFNSKESPHKSEYTIRFISPCRMERKIPDIQTGIKGKKKLILPELFSFDIFIQSLKTRYLALMKQFSSPDAAIEQHLETVKAYIDNSTRLVLKDLEMIKVLRVNPRTGKWKHCDGFTGKITLADLHPYTAQLIEFSAIMHLGKFATYGYGDISLK